MPDPSKPSPLPKNDLAILRASLFLGAFALLQSSIVKAVEFFYHVGEPSGDQWKKYIEEVMILSDDTFESCCVWLEKNKVVKPRQFTCLMDIKKRHDFVHQNFSRLVMQDIVNADKKQEETDSSFLLEKRDFDELTELFHRIEVWRTAVDYGLTYTGEEEDLEEIFPISVIGMMRMTNLAFPDHSAENTGQQ